MSLLNELFILNCMLDYLKGYGRLSLKLEGFVLDLKHGIWFALSETGFVSLVFHSNKLVFL
jgi:hypothetical protein